MPITIPDLHGRADLLDAVLAHYPAETSFVFLGDAIDRGPNSREVVRTLLRLSEEGRLTIVRGNHEHMLLEGWRRTRAWQESGLVAERVAGRNNFQNWLRNGGKRTMREYGDFDETNLPQELQQYLERTVVSFQHRSILCSHAAPPVKHPRYRTPEDVALWSRPDDGPFPLPEGVRATVHGHTPLASPTWVGPHLYTDLGAVHSGALCTVDLDDLSVKVFQGKGDVPLDQLPELTANRGGLIGHPEFVVIPVA
ncbi:MAG TPA: metallophosphoesterase [Deinococcales bacterium]|nr:metallophosphoesterase [Deinococcales bacterium]